MVAGLHDGVATGGHDLLAADDHDGGGPVGEADLGEGLAADGDLFADLVDVDLAVPSPGHSIAMRIATVRTMVGEDPGIVRASKIFVCFFLSSFG